MNTTHTNGPIEQKEKQKATRLPDELDLRDYFAAKAMQGMLANDIECGPEQVPIIVESAYVLADAMLKERLK